MKIKTEELRIRDPFILLSEDLYYLYGTRSATAWGPADGFDVYVSDNLMDWDGPFEIFHKPEGFWATDSYWAPECVKIGDQYFLLATFGSSERKKGIQVLSSPDPMGPFTPLTDLPITPEEWSCLDGTLYLDPEETPWLIFSHSVPEELKGAICALRLRKDFSGADGEVKTLFYAQEAPWSRPIPFAKAEFGVDGDAFFSDGPCMIPGKDGALLMLWSSWGEKGYCMGLSRSPSGSLFGPWEHGDAPFAQGGGHGMIFAAKDGKCLLTYHTPNDFGKEHPVFIPFEG